MTRRPRRLCLVVDLESRRGRHDTKPSTVIAADGTLAVTTSPKVAASMARAASKARHPTAHLAGPEDAA